MSIFNAEHSYIRIISFFLSLKYANQSFGNVVTYLIVMKS
jgi:hypothetical protein